MRNLNCVSPPLPNAIRSSKTRNADLDPYHNLLILLVLFS